MRLIHDVLGRYFRAVLGASLLVLGTGVWMIGRVAKQVVQAGGTVQMPPYWTLMAALGVLMVAIFMHIRFALYKRHRSADERAAEAGSRVGQAGTG